MTQFSDLRSLSPPFILYQFIILHWKGERGIWRSETHAYVSSFVVTWRATELKDPGKQSHEPKPTGRSCPRASPAEGALPALRNSAPWLGSWDGHGFRISRSQACPSTALAPGTTPVTSARSSTSRVSTRHFVCLASS